MYEIRQTDVFRQWFRALRDQRGKVRIAARLRAAKLGNLGDWKSLGAGLQEMRIHTGPGYRLYYAQRGQVVILLLCAGDKSSQFGDIEQARRLLQAVNEEGSHAQGESD